MAQANEDAGYLSTLGAGQVISLGNIKLGAPALPVDESQLSLLLNALDDRPRWLFASSHNGEEELVANIHMSLCHKKPNALTIIGPRHPERGTVIAELMRSKGLKTGLRSNGDVPNENTDIYVADTMGELGLFYRLCDIVFMGKSLVSPGGGQNPFEAAKLDRVVLFGPNMGNFVELASIMIESGAATQVRDARELQDELEVLFSSPEKIKGRMDKATAFCLNSENIIESSVNEILKIFPNHKNL